MGHLSAYASVGSSPKAPLDPGTAAFVKGEPPITQPAEMTTAQLKAEARATIKHLDTLLPRMVELLELFKKRWREFGPTRDLACNEMFGCGLNALHKRLSYRTQQLDKAEEAYLTLEEDEKNTLTQVAALEHQTKEDLMASLNADLEAQLEKPVVHAGPAPEPEPTAAPKPKAVPERQPRERNDNGKPIYALPVWGEMEAYCGKLLNRVDMAHQVLPDKKEHDGIIEDVHGVGERIRRWRERSRK